ncbi:MAG TPA: flagellar basal body M-ring protein FliF [Gammaproteobacteria bacterium]|nr:flagellar basal body M-ring protein FliF [Gammaproteobacteria bacterium]
MAEATSPGISDYLEGFRRLPLARQIGLIAAVAAVIALTVLVLMWARQPTYRTLYSSLELRDAGEIVQAIEQLKVPYRLEEKSGDIMVPAGKVHEVRLQLAAQGLPKGGGVDGFELLDRQQGFGISRFMESTRYQRALEGELARSIATIESVRSARVHLALPKQSVFIRDREKPSASVVVNLHRGYTPTRQQVQAMVHLVASSIPGLAADRVTVVDQGGTLLTGRDRSGELELSNQQFAYTRRVERSYVERIETILAPILGNNGVKAQVSAELDFTRSERTRESYDPDNSVIRSEQRAVEQLFDGTESGIPGALSNEPPGAAVAPEQAGATDAENGGPPLRRKSNTTINYEVDKTISHIRTPIGTVRRLSVAVVVDDKLTTDENGEPQRTPRSPEELEQLTALVKEAVGFNAERGDSVNVISASFVAEPEDKEEEPPLWQQPWVFDIGKQLLGWILALILIFAVLRPLLRSLTQIPSPATRGEEGDLDEYELQEELSREEAQRERRNPAASHEENLQTAKEIARQDPKRVVQVVRTWLEEEQPSG